MLPIKRGSLWNKWDLHVHTPLSLDQEYGGDTPAAWNAFIKKISELPKEIKVIGITDYLFLDGYSKLLERRSDIPNIDLIIPNIEFRLDTFSGTPNNTKRHNFHVLFDPTLEVQIIQEQFLNSLSKAYNVTTGIEWNNTPTKRSLEELGKSIQKVAPAGNSIHSKTALQVGFDNITYNRKEIMELLSKSSFKGKYVVGIGYSEWDQSRWDQSAAEKRTLINSSNFSLTSLKDIQKIKENVEDLKKNNLQNLVLHSSDAHEINTIGDTLLWIKGDTTFSGLKQVLNEQSRVFIGETPPDYKQSHQIISSVTIKNSNGWFDANFTLPINRDMVSVIGGRGCGKSALVEMIVYGAGQYDDSSDSFLNKALKYSKTIKGTEIILDWEDGHQTSHTIGEHLGDEDMVRYLPQKAVEQLCSPGNSDKLQEQIESVIFSALSPTERKGSSNFKELEEKILEKTSYEKGKVITNLTSFISEYKTLVDRSKTLSTKEEELKNRKDIYEKAKLELPVLSEEDQKSQDELTQLLELKKKFEVKIIELENKSEKTDIAKTKIKIIADFLTEQLTVASELFKEVGVEDLSILAIPFDKEKFNKVLTDRKIALDAEITSLFNGNKETCTKLLDIPTEKLLSDNYTLLTEKIDQKTQETKDFETLKIKYQKQKGLLLETERTITSLEQEIAIIKEEIIPNVENTKEKMIDCFCDIFSILKIEKELVEKLYSPLRDYLSNGTEADKRLDFEAKIHFDIDTQLQQGLLVIDRTRKGNYKDKEQLRVALQAYWDKINSSSFDLTNIKSALLELEKSFIKGANEENYEIEEQLRESLTLANFYSWLLATANYYVKSFIKFDSTDLDMLSPGKKGIVLLLLYLAVDKSDTRPLIIDQPEDNLDSLSVYKDLLDCFKDRKIYRQIIIVTHNANLVVNTDSEQVIVANFDAAHDPRLTYSAGSLENKAEEIPTVSIENYEDGVIDQVCKILEGGDVAFTNRKKKYLLSPKFTTN